MRFSERYRTGLVWTERGGGDGGQNSDIRNDMDMGDVIWLCLPGASPLCYRIGPVTSSPLFTYSFIFIF